MSINPIHHYSIENPATIYDEESMTSLELAARTAAKVNEAIAAFLELEAATAVRLGKIPDEIEAQVLAHITNGDFDAAINLYAGELENRLDNLLSNTPNGSTTMDAEIVDGRLGQDGVTYDNLGSAIRGQFKGRIRYGLPFITQDPQINIDPDARTVTIGKSFYVAYDGSYPIIPDTYEMPADGNVLYCAFDKTMNWGGDGYKPEFMKPSAYDPAKHIVVFGMSVNALANGVDACTLPFNYMVRGKYIRRAGENPDGGDLFFTGTSDPKIAFDTVGRTLSMPACYVMHGPARYDFAAATLTIPETNTNWVVVDKTTKAMGIVAGSALDLAHHVPVFLFNYDYITNPASNTLPFRYWVDGVAYSRFNYQGGDGEKVVSVSGASALVKMQKYINEGYTTIVIAPSTCTASAVTIENKDNIKIIVEDTGYDARQPKKNVMVNNAMKLTTSKATGSYSGLLYATVSRSSSTNWYKVFTSKELPVTRAGTKTPAYNAILWAVGVDITDVVQMHPVLSLDLCAATPSSFFWNSTDRKVYINPPTEGGPYLYYRPNIEEGSLFKVKGCNNFYMENIEFLFLPEYIEFDNISRCEVRNCKVGYTAYSGGFKIDGTNGSFHKCEAYMVNSDGFGIGGESNGYTEFFDCSGHHCGDDGISHHNGSEGAIYGGEWYNNGKGGVSPAHGAVVNVYNAYSHNNQYGFYVFSDNTVAAALGRKILLSHCTSKSNTSGLYYGRYNVTAVGCNFVDGKTKGATDNTTLTET